MASENDLFDRAMHWFEGVEGVLSASVDTEVVTMASPRRVGHTVAVVIPKAELSKGFQLYRETARTAFPKDSREVGTFRLLLIAIGETIDSASPDVSTVYFDAVDGFTVREGPLSVSRKLPKDSSGTFVPLKSTGDTPLGSEANEIGN